MSEKVMGDLKIYAANKPAKFVAHPLYDNFGDIISRQAARTQLSIDLNAPLLLFFGFIRKYKGLDLLFDAMKILQTSRPDIKLLVAGEF
jgi:glycosyltransferase involved in cell wall biosynthesis